MARKAETIDGGGYFEENTHAVRFDENHLNPASVRLIWVQLFVLYLGVATD